MVILGFIMNKAINGWLLERVSMPQEYFLYLEFVILFALIYFLYRKRLKNWIMGMELKDQIFVLIIFITIVCLWWTRYGVYPISMHDNGQAAYKLDRFTGEFELIYGDRIEPVLPSRLFFPGFSLLIINLILVVISIFRIFPIIISKFRKRGTS